MTALAANITDSQTLIPVDAGLTNGTFQLPLYYTVDSEAIRVTGRAHRTTWLVERGIAGTTADSHSSAATLTRYYPEAATGTAGAGVPDPTGAPDGQVPTTADGEYALSSENGGITATDPVSGAEASVVLQAPNDNGLASAGLNATDANDAGATAFLEATTEGGAALVSSKATATAGGSATARLDAESVGGLGDTEARVAIVAAGVPQIGVVASFVFGGAQALTILDGAQGFAGDPGDVLTAHATAGTAWEAPAKADFVDPTTATAEDIANALIAAGLMDAS